jgi:hypothetical protein
MSSCLSDRLSSSSAIPAALAHADHYLLWIFGLSLVDVHEPISIIEPLSREEHRWYDHDGG